MCVHEGGHRQQSFTGLVINGARWWTSCLPFGPVLPTLPLTPGSPRDEGGHGQQSFTGLVVLNRGLWWTSCLPLGPGLPSLPLIPGTPRHVQWKDVKSRTSIIIECLEGEEERKWNT